MFSAIAWSAAIELTSLLNTVKMASEPPPEKPIPAKSSLFPKKSLRQLWEAVSAHGTNPSKSCAWKCNLKKKTRIVRKR